MRRAVTLLLILGALASAAPAAVGGDDAPYDTGGRWSRTLEPGPHERLPPEVVDVPSFDGTPLNVGLFRPDLPAGARAPVLLDAGPYYGETDVPVGSDQSRRLGSFLIEQFVPHGYVVAQASVRGTGASGGCFDYLGETEQRDLDALITWLAEQAWSNGHVAVLGRSYDGAVAWEAASTGNPHLKTIVPISGMSDVQQMHFRNGTSERRTLVLGATYSAYGATQGGSPETEPDPRLLGRACPGTAEHVPLAAAGYATGGAAMLDYWRARDFGPRVAESYHGSVFYVHGLQDGNVRPNQGADVYNSLQGEKKAWLGQWAHAYPDRPAEHRHLRWDWAETLLRWLDRELKGLDVDTGPAVEVEDHQGHWRAEPANAWPPLDAAWTALHPSADGALVERGAQGETLLVDPAPAALVGQPTPAAPRVVVFTSAPLARETHVSGTPRLHVTVAPLSPGGNLLAEIHEVAPDGTSVRLGRAHMDLRYAAGGKEAHPVAPGVDIVARMEFFPMDARVPAGHRLALHVMQEGERLEPMPNAAGAGVVVKLGDERSVLLLPLVERPFVPSRWDVGPG